MESPSPNRRRIGAYYTPGSVAETLVAWANPDPSGRILDPSFGGCSFLSAAVEQARSAGVGPSGVFGVDIDELAFKFASELITQGFPMANMVKSNFFDVSVRTLGGEFAAVVGNPPYIRHHWLDEEQKLSAQQAAKAAGVTLPRTADIWAYFTAHSTSFLRKGGRLAFLLPSSVIYAHYAEAVIAKLQASFKQVVLVRLAERLFSDTHTQSIVMLCSGYGQGPTNMVLTDIEKATDLDETLNNLPETINPSNRRELTIARLTDAQREAWIRLTEIEQVEKLGSVAVIRIGVVTGANNLFVHPSKDVLDFIGQQCRSLGVIRRASDLGMPMLLDTDMHDSNGQEYGYRLLVITGELDNLSYPLQRLIMKAEEDGIHMRSHTSKRDVWYQLTDTAIPDAFLPYMGADPYPLTLNKAKATSTNGVHRIWWNSAKWTIEDAIVGSWTSLFQLAAEINGRQYGGGILKLEPAEARQLAIPIVEGAKAVLPELDSLARVGDKDTVTDLADDVVLRQGLGISNQQIMSLRSGASALAELRQVSNR